MDLHGFRVVPMGPVTAGFTRALRRLAERGYVDAGCTIVKTAAGPWSGITHAGGRYVHADNPSAGAVLAEMRRQGIELPSMPFIVTPGPITLFHEWGHHVDRLWSGGDRDVLFSFRWFSQFYGIRLRRPDDEVRWPAVAEGAWIGSPLDAADAVPAWHVRTSELFATLFEEWMGERRSAAGDCCSPEDLNGPWQGGSERVMLVLRPGCSASEVRARTCARFGSGQREPVEMPGLRDDLFEAHTASTMASFRAAMARLRTGA